MLLLQLIEEIRDTPSCIKFLRERFILRSIPPQCKICQRVMSEVKKNDINDGVVYRCPSHKENKVSIRIGSFLEKSRLELKEFIMLAYFWSHEIPNHTAIKMLGMSKETIVNWYNYFRDVCCHYLDEHPFTIGGVNHIVEIDESVISKRKYHIGHMVPERWVFGGVDRQTNIGFLVLVPNRSSDTLLPLIQKYILPGTRIYSDQWAAYSGISNLPVDPPYIHETVNHSENFVDPISGACTNTVESFWRISKRKFKSMSGTSEVLIPSYLNEFQWRQFFGKNENDAFNNILLHISQWYIVPH